MQSKANMDKFEQGIRKVDEILDDVFAPFDGLFDTKVPNSVLNHDGDIIIRGRVKSVTVNGYRVRLPKNTLRGD